MTGEEARLAALHRLNLLDTAPSESFDRITRIAAQLFGLPRAAVSLTDRDWQWFKSRVGIEAAEIPRHQAPCAAVALQSEVLVLGDLHEDPRYAAGPLAAAGIRFYAGAPLVTREGHGLGALCVFGTEPRAATPAEMAGLRDLAAMVMAQIELEHAGGRLDPISGLPNRIQFIDDMADLARDHAGERRMAVLVELARPEEVDNILRAMGPEKVDAIVRDSADLLRAELGPDRTAYHIATKRFLFVSLPVADEAGYVRELAAAVHRVRATAKVRFITTLGLGVMPFTVGAVGPLEMMRGAHIALRDVQHRDGAVSFYSAERDHGFRRRFELLKEFGHALEAGNQLRLVYQPRIDLVTCRCVGAEALLRWRHPRLGDIPASEFTPLLEQTSLVGLVTRWVVSTACAQMAEWRGRVDLPVSVNVTPASFADESFAHGIVACIEAHDLDYGMLDIELTERALMTGGDAALDALRLLAGLGVRIAIDDFGTGYSSLAYLQRLPAHVVKIDQSFVRNLTCAPTPDNALVTAMVTMAQRLHYRIIAEGIETAAAVDALVGMGCDEGQGYLFSPALEADAFERWVLARNALRAA